MKNKDKTIDEGGLSKLIEYNVSTEGGSSYD